MFHPSLFEVQEVLSLSSSLSPEHGQQCCTPTVNCSALLAAIWQNLTNIP